MPEARIKFGTNHSSAKQEISFEFIADLFPEKPPIEEMVPSEVLLEIVRNGVKEKTLSFNLNKDGIWKVDWVLENKKDLDEYSLFTITKYKNGFEQRMGIEQFEGFSKKFSDQ